MKRGGVFLYRIYILVFFDNYMDLAGESVEHLAN